MPGPLPPPSAESAAEDRLSRPRLAARARWRPEHVFASAEAGAHCVLDRRGGIALHTHDFLELNVVAAGSGYHHVDGRWRKVREGDVFVLRPGAHHAYENAGGLQVYDLLFRPRLLEESLPRVLGVAGAAALLPLGGAADPRVPHRADPGLALDGPAREQIFPLLARASSESASAAAPAAAEWICLYALSLLCRSFAAQPGAPAIDPPALPVAVARAVEHMATHRADPLTVAAIARAAGVSPAHLRRLFLRATGVSPQRYLVDLRLRAARALLADPARTVTDVAAEAGFYDAAHLTRHFVRAFGASPRRWRVGALDDAAGHEKPRV